MTAPLEASMSGKILASLGASRCNHEDYAGNCRKCGKLSDEDLRGVAFTRDREKRLKQKYGLTADDYNEMHEKQNGVCAICFKKCSTRDRLSVDHDHATGAVRGLLCTKCNTGIGWFRDDPNILLQATRYLRHGPIPAASDDVC